MKSALEIQCIIIICIIIIIITIIYYYYCCYYLCASTFFYYFPYISNFLFLHFQHNRKQKYTK